MTQKSILLNLLLSVFLISCVSVQLSPNKSRKAENISYQQPANYFKKIEAENADMAWQSQKTGNTIAFISECGQADPSLISIENETLAVFTKPKVIKSDLVQFSDREAIENLIEGQVDGVAVKIKQVIFKKNGCSFIISFVGRKNKFDAEISDFEKWKGTVRVP